MFAIKDDSKCQLPQSCQRSLRVDREIAHTLEPFHKFRQYFLYSPFHQYTPDEPEALSRRFCRVRFFQRFYHQTVIPPIPTHWSVHNGSQVKVVDQAGTKTHACSSASLSSSPTFYINTNSIHQSLPSPK